MQSTKTMYRNMVNLTNHETRQNKWGWRGAWGCTIQCRQHCEHKGASLKVCVYAFPSRKNTTAALTYKHFSFSTRKSTVYISVVGVQHISCMSGSLSCLHKMSKWWWWQLFVVFSGFVSGAHIAACENKLIWVSYYVFHHWHHRSF